MKELLTRNECTAMRGIAILAIVLHNYCHFISKIVQENEYQFFVSHNEQLWQVVTNPDALLPVHLLSFFGHYGSRFHHYLWVKPKLPHLTWPESQAPPPCSPN